MEKHNRVTLRIELLGGFRVSVGTRTVGEDAWRLKKAASTIKLLALARGHRLHRERVMDLLWPELTPGAAANNLRQTLYAARRTLGTISDTDSQYLQLQNETLLLCPDDELWVDVEEFEAATVNWRLGSVYRRLGFSSRSEATRFATEHDLLP